MENNKLEPDLLPWNLQNSQELLTQGPFFFRVMNAQDQKKENSQIPINLLFSKPSISNCFKYIFNGQRFYLVIIQVTFFQTSFGLTNHLLSLSLKSLATIGLQWTDWHKKIIF